MEELPKPRSCFIPINKRQTQSLSLITFNDVLTQRRGSIKKQMSQANSMLLNTNLLNSNSPINFNILNMSKTWLASEFTHYPLFFKACQEMMLFHRPFPFIIILGLLNLGFYFYHSFDLPFYALIILSVLLYFIAKLLIPRIWPIVYETLFLSEIKVDDTLSNRIYSEYEVANFIFERLNPIRLIMKAAVRLSNDQSVSGLQVMLGIYAFLFFLTATFDLFYPLVIITNFILIAPGVCLNPLVNALYKGFIKRWHIKI